MKRLIVSADDLGLTRSVNEGIAKACREGVVTNVNLIPTGEAFDDAIRLVKELGLTEAGAHLALTETAPLSVHNKIPTLVMPSGKFRAHHGGLAAALLLGRVDLDQAYIELRTQLAAAASAGVRITSLSSHEHIHLLPQLGEIFAKLAIEYDIPCVRLPRRETCACASGVRALYKNTILTVLGAKAARLLQEAGLAATDHFRGLLDSGAMTEDCLVRQVASLEEGTTELVTHPGFLGPEVLSRYPFHRRAEEEVYALTGKPVRRALEAGSISLSRFSDLEKR